HLAAGGGAALAASFFTSSLSGSPAMLLLIPLAGYLAYRISLQIERSFPGTSLEYYRKGLAGAQVYWPGPDCVSAPLVVPDEE
ncbi:MAG: hypothetical protein NZ846_12080, partial [Thermus sp.]